MDKGHDIGAVLPVPDLYGLRAAAPIPMILVTGFLGSGKTTLVRNFLEEIDTGKQIAVVQNEYAAAGIDSRLLEQSRREFEILEVNQGSVFCVCLLGSFIPSLSAFLDEKKPDLLIIETTGLADPIAIAEIITAPALSERIYLASVCCVVDALNFERMQKVNTRIYRQIRIADHILVNKTDLVDGALDGLLNRIRQQNKNADIHETVHARIPDPGILEPKEAPLAFQRRTEHSGYQPEGRSDIKTFVIKTSRPVSLENLRKFIDNSGSGLIRLKGFVLLDDDVLAEVQHVFGETIISRREGFVGNTELVGLGWGIDSRNFGRRFHETRKG